MPTWNSQARLSHVYLSQTRAAMGPRRAFSGPPAAPSLAAGSLAAGSRARADPEGQAPAHSRPRAACQTRREGSALYGPPDGRKCLVGPGEEAPYMARGRPGAGSPPGMEAVSAAAGWRRNAPPPPRARACGPLPSGGPRPQPEPSVSAVQQLQESGAPAGRAAGDPTRLGRLTQPSWIPSAATHSPSVLG